MSYHNVQRSIFRTAHVNSLKNVADAIDVVDAESVHSAFLDNEFFMKYGKTAIGKSFFKCAHKVEATVDSEEFSYIMNCQTIFAVLSTVLSRCSSASIYWTPLSKYVMAFSINYELCTSHIWMIWMIHLTLFVILYFVLYCIQFDFFD